jgi:glycosyltransferase involved in cell wall biosynthesis
LPNVLHVYRTYFPDPPGGLQEAIRQICLATKDRLVRSSVFTLSPVPLPAVVELEEGRVVRARSWWAPASCDLGSLASFSRFSEEARKADILHFHFPWPFADVLSFLPAVKSKPKILTYHSDIVRQRLLASAYHPLMQHTLRSMDAVVATSPNYAASSAVLNDVVDKAKLRIIPLGIKDRAHSNAAVLRNHSDILKRLNLTGSDFVLALGVLRYYKGLHTLIHAANAIPAPIVIVGSGPEESNLKRLTQKLNVANVIFAGQVTDGEKDALLNACTVFAFPSHLRSEAFGMALVEASMFSKPMVTCEISSGTSYVNQDGVTGSIVSPEEPKCLAEAINRLLKDASLGERMGKAARARYLELFSGEALGRAYTSLYEEVLAIRTY